MKHLILSLSIAAGCLTASALPVTFYAPESVLRSGEWVKVGVDATGLYELTYDQLAAMGFSNPEKVCVYGRGGRRMSEHFTDSNGRILIDNDLKQVATTHIGDKLFFYAVGPQEFELEGVKYEDLPAYFANKGKNIYSNRGYYFLTASGTPLQMSASEVDNELVTVTSGYDFIYHEEDKALNNSDSGQFFWGESFLNESDRRQTWSYTLHNVIADAPAIADCSFYVPKTSVGTLRFGVEGASKNVEFPFTTSTNYYFRPIMGKEGASAGKTFSTVAGIPAVGKMFVEYQPSLDDEEYANLDYWSLTYQKNIPTLRGVDGSKLPQEHISFYNVDQEKGLTFTMPDGFSFNAIDVSDPTMPRLIKVNQEGSDGVAVFAPAVANPSVIVFDPRRTQHTISGFKSGYKMLANQNLHRQASAGAELIIICAEQLRTQAEDLAELHRRYDGIRVIVATVEEVYNEFSAGVPDPMAYRSFAKMTYMADKKLKNILLFGPITNDVRGLRAERDPFNVIIGYQSPNITVEKGAPNVNDFYGMMTDYFDTNIEQQSVEIGVGLLPCSFTAEADRVVRKVERYITDPDHVYTLSEFLTIGGLGDNHVHDEQAIDLGNYINISTNSHMVLSTLIIDAYGSKAARKKLFEYFDAGKTLAVYFGHGSPSMLGKDKNFFSSDQVGLLRNTRMPFMMFAGCEITNTDRGERGLGESLVTATDYGLIGAVVATRDTWSGLNLEYMKILTNKFYKDGDDISSPRLAQPLTVGEVFARSKTQSKSTNELNYQLICDPAIIVPVANRRIAYASNSYNVTPGEPILIKGEIKDVNNETDKSFNGELVFKLLEPINTLASADLETKTFASTGKQCKVDYRDYIVTMQTTQVKDGVFNVNFNVPAGVVEFANKDCLLIGTAYDSSRRLGAGARVTLKVKEPSGNIAIAEDNVAPVFERFEYDAEAEAIRVSVTDETAMDMSYSPFSNSFYMTVDGRSYTLGSNSPKILHAEGQGYDKVISTAHLSAGYHTAKITVRDAAGNASTSELAFTIGDTTQPFVLMAEDAITHDACRLYVQGGVREPRLIIMDSKGNHIIDTEINGSEYIWNHCDASGNPLPAGLYRAFILENGTHSDKRHSEPIDLPVI